MIVVKINNIIVCQQMQIDDYLNKGSRLIDVILRYIPKPIYKIIDVCYRRKNPLTRAYKRRLPRLYQKRLT
jgi:hypothetical protein